MAEGFAAGAGVILKAFEALLNMLLKKRDYQAAEIKEVLGPLHEEFQRIHLAYLDMFDELATDLHGLEYRPPSDAEIELRRVTKAFCDARDSCDRIRDRFRGNIAGVLDNVQDEKWRNYLTAVANYIIRDNNHHKGKSLSTVEMLRDSLVRRSGESVFETPSSKLYLDIKNAASPSEALAYVNEAIVALALKEAVVTRCYYAIRLRDH